MKYYALEYFRGDDKAIVDAKVVYLPPKDEYYDLADSLFEKKDSLKFTVLPPLKKLREDFFRVTSGEFFGVKRLSDVVKRFQEDVQLISAAGEYSNGEFIGDEYFLIHPGKRVLAFDYDESAYSGKAMILSEREGGKPARLVKGITNIVLNRGMIGDNNYFFLGNVIYYHPIVSESLLEELLGNKFNLSYTLIEVA